MTQTPHIVVNGIQYFPRCERETGEELHLLLRRARMRMGLSLDSAADQLGMSRASLHLYETGKAKDPKISVVLSFQRVYGLDVEVFM